MPSIKLAEIFGSGSGKTEKQGYSLFISLKWINIGILVAVYIAGWGTESGRPGCEKMSS
jgi:hypothetical protein